jgi:hypothetical protein
MACGFLLTIDEHKPPNCHPEERSQFERDEGSRTVILDSFLSTEKHKFFVHIFCVQAVCIIWPRFLTRALKGTTFGMALEGNICERRLSNALNTVHIPVCAT